MGFSLAITMVIYGVAMPYFSIAKAKVLDDTSVYFSNVSLGEYNGNLSLILDSDPPSLVNGKIHLVAQNFIGCFDTFLTIHLHAIIKTLFKITQETVVVFDIKELKFPTHYFW